MLCIIDFRQDDPVISVVDIPAVLFFVPFHPAVIAVIGRDSLVPVLPDRRIDVLVVPEIAVRHLVIIAVILIRPGTGPVDRFNVEGLFPVFRCVACAGRTSALCLSVPA